MAVMDTPDAPPSPRLILPSSLISRLLRNHVVGSIVTHFEEKTRKVQRGSASATDIRILELLAELDATVRSRASERDSEE